MSNAQAVSPGTRRSAFAPLGAFVGSSVGKKAIVAVTGIILILFVIGHLAGNLTIFLGQDAINAYAVKLRDLGPLLWVARIGLLIAVGLHIYFTVVLTVENRQARPVSYIMKKSIRSTIFARTMRLSGVFLIAFIIFHLAHFTLFLVHPEYRNLHDAQGRHDVYSMVILGFQSPIVSLFYIVSLFLLAFHLSHGIGSLFQTLGISNKVLRPFYEKSARVLAWLLFIGYTSIPTSVLLGILKLPAQP